MDDEDEGQKIIVQMEIIHLVDMMETVVQHRVQIHELQRHDLHMAQQRENVV